MQVTTTKWTNTYHFWIRRETQHSPTETAFQFIPCLDLLFIFSSSSLHLLFIFSSSSLQSLPSHPLLPRQREATNRTCDRSDNFDAKSGITNMGHNSLVTGCDRWISSCHSCGIKEYHNVRTARWHRAVEKKHILRLGPVKVVARRFVGQLKRL